MRKVVLKKSSLSRVSLILIIGLILAFFATSVIQNPDMDNYEVLLEACSISSPCAVEPLFWLMADIANISDFGVLALYALYIVFTLFFI
jgi:hypothetical protein